jgi:ABC-type glycerol-3-phosphate transport system substrate-binding protein
LDGLTNILQDPDWYVFARELGSVKNAAYSIPFAADVVMTVYNSSVFETPPPDWESVFDSESQIAFAFSGTQSYFPLSLYSSVKDQLTDEQGLFTLDENALVRVLLFYQRAYESDALLPSYKNIQSDVDALNSFQSGSSDLVVVWASSDIGTNSGSYAPLLSLDNVPHSIGNGWVWALAGSNTENQALAIELASYLVESEYMSEWTYTSGFLPTRPRALDGWEDETVRDAMNNVLLAAHPIPPADMVSIFGPLMEDAMTRVFSGEQPEVVARSVIESLP